MITPLMRRLFRPSAYSLRETFLLVLVDVGVLSSVAFSVFMLLWTETAF